MISAEYAIKKGRFEKKVTLNYILDDDSFMGAQWGVQGHNTDVFIVKDTGENEILESTVVKTFYPNGPMGLLLKISDFKMRYLMYKITYNGGFYEAMEKDLKRYGVDIALPGPLTLYPPERD